MNTHDMQYHLVSDRVRLFGLMMGELLEDLSFLARVHHQDRAGSVAGNRIGDASVDVPPYPVAASTPHDDQVRFQLLGQAHDLLVALNCTVLRSWLCRSGVNTTSVSAPRCRPTCSFESESGESRLL
jgi:hypothetical protein